MEPLRDYQKDAIKFALEKKRCYLALDMGLGKTRIALEYIRTTKESARGFLVIAPIRTIGTTWPDEIAKWTPEITYTILHGPHKNRAFNQDVDVYLMNYEGIAWLHGMLQKSFKLHKRLPFHGIIYDEGSMVKSWKTKRFKALKTFRTLFPYYRLILGGTPAPNSLKDLWSQYYLLDDGARLGTGSTKFLDTYFEADPYCHWSHTLLPGAKEEIYKLVADITYRLDSADHLNLPERIDNVIPVVLPDNLMKQYKQLEKKFFLDLEEAQVTAMTAATLSMKLRQFIQGAMYTDSAGNYEVIHKEKVKILKSLVEEAGGQGILCAVQFRFEVDMIHEVFPDAPVIAKGVKLAVSNQYIKEWNEGKIPLLLCHPASLSHGVNMQHGSHIILWFGLTWSLEHYLQLNKRLHRSGQLNNVIVHHLVAKDTIDERVLQAVRIKGINQEEFLQYIKNYQRG